MRHNRRERRRILHVGEGIQGRVPDISVRILQRGHDRPGAVHHLEQPDCPESERAAPPPVASQQPVGHRRQRHRAYDRASRGDALWIAIDDERRDQQPGDVESVA